MATRPISHGLRLRGIYAFVLTFLVSGLLSASQTTSGTIVVVVHTKKQAAIAADSRATVTMNNNERVFDGMCKLAVLGDDLVFAATGYTFTRSSIVPKEHRFDFYTVATEVVAAYNTSSSSHNSNRKVEKIAQRWGQEVVERFQAAAPYALGRWLKDIHKNRLGDGVFVGVEPSGEIAVAIVEFTYQGPSARNVAAAEVNVHGPTSAPHVDARGHGDVADEYIYLRSERAKVEQEQWQQWGRESPESLEVRITKRLVELTIALHPKRWEVGGKIDVIALKQRGAPRWISLKQGCPERGFSTDFLKQRLKELK